MNKVEILDKLYNNKLSINKAYKKLYLPKSPKKAHFVKLRIIIPDEKAVSAFVNILFLLPLPLFIVKFFLKRSDRYISDDIPIPIKDIVDLIGVKGAFIDVLANDKTKVLIKTI